MARLLHRYQRFFLGVAFVGVLSGTGGLMGAIGGVVLVLLGRAVLGLASGLAQLVLASIAVGTGTALLLGLFLMARQALPASFLPGVASAAASEHN
ncbi:MAG: hypothetical protein IVW55_03865 [Chloroflexi bacterium]|nr:hypothetical protein [Chloroflexota bacterium]